MWRSAVERAARAAGDAVGRQAWMGDAVRVDIVACFATPKAERWGRLHTAKPDKDNVEKLVLDAMERAGLLLKGDQRVSIGETSKLWAETGSVTVVMRPGVPRRTGQPKAAAPDWLTA
jgi:Holliday junction resolvase RusA-like endonuclease